MSKFPISRDKEWQSRRLQAPQHLYADSHFYDTMKQTGRMTGQEWEPQGPKHHVSAKHVPTIVHCIVLLQWINRMCLPLSWRSITKCGARNRNMYMLHLFNTSLCLFQGNWGQFQGNWSQTEIPQYDNAFDPKQLPSRVPPIMGTFDPSHFDPIQGIHIWLILIDPKHGSQIHIHIGPQRFQGEREWRPLLPLLLAAAARAWRPTRPANPMDYRRSVLVNWGYKYIKKIYT